MYRDKWWMIALGAVLMVSGLYAQQSIVVPDDALDWQDLSKLKNIPKYEVPALGALVDDCQGPPVILWQGQSEVDLRVPLPAAGRYTLRIAYLSGGDYKPLTFSTPFGELGTTSASPAKPCVVISTFQTPMVPGQYLDLTIKVTEPDGRIGLLYIQPQICQYDGIPAEHWRIFQSEDSFDQYVERYGIDEHGAIGLPDGAVEAKVDQQETSRIVVFADKTVLAVTHFFCDTAFSGYAFEMHARNDATLFINGSRIIDLGQGKLRKVGYIPWNKLNRGLNRIAVLMPASGRDAGTSWFELRSSAAEHTAFYSHIPAELDIRDANTDWPRVTLVNERVRAVVPLPDMSKGYYRSVRFEAAGQMTEMIINQHNMFTSHLPGRQPLDVSAAAGPAEAFFEPVGYHDAQPGQPFMKVGVGLLRRPLDHEYFIGSAFVPIQFFGWQTHVERDAITFMQDGQSSRGDAYHYEKYLKLTDNPPGLIIEHRLTNTGRHRLCTSHYSHNFIRMDEAKIGSDYQLDFAFSPIPARNVLSRLSIKGRRAIPSGKKTVFTEIFGYQGIHDSNVIVRYLPGDLKFSISLDQPLIRFWLYCTDRVLCPEMFTRIDLLPGQTKRWVSTYKMM